MTGFTVGIIGIALCVLMCGVGSTIGLCLTGQAAAGVLAEQPKKFSKILIFMVIPTTQGIYGFVLAIIAQGYLGTITTVAEGWALLAAVMPLAVVALLAGVYQSRSAVSCIYAVARNESLTGKLLLFPAMIETYTILGLVISILLLGII